MTVRRLTVAFSLVLVAILAPCSAAAVRAAYGVMELPPITEGTGPHFYHAAEYDLETGDKIDYAFVASDKIFFAILWHPSAGLGPISDKVSEDNITRGIGIFEADWPGTYYFAFGTDNTTSSREVSYNIHPSESWPARWGPVLVVISAASVFFLGAVAIVVKKSRKKAL